MALPRDALRHCARKFNCGSGGFAIAAYIPQIGNHVGNAILNRIQPFFFGESVFGSSLILVGKNELVQGVSRVGVGICPASVFDVFCECSMFVRGKPSAFKESSTGEKLLFDHVGSNHVVGVFLFAGGVKECYRRKRHVVVIFIVAVVCGRTPAGCFLVMDKGLAIVVRIFAQRQGFGEVVHSFGNQ